MHSHLQDNGFLRFTSSVTPAELLLASMAVGHIPYISSRSRIWSGGRGQNFFPRKFWFGGDRGEFVKGPTLCILWPLHLQLVIESNTFSLLQNKSVYICHLSKANHKRLFISIMDQKLSQTFHFLLFPFKIFCKLFIVISTITNMCDV